MNFLQKKKVEPPRYDPPERSGGGEEKHRNINRPDEKTTYEFTTDENFYEPKTKDSPNPPFHESFHKKQINYFSLLI